jgi:hypothetical protein
VYDAPRVMRILGSDEKEKTVMVGANVPAQMPVPEGVERIYDLGVGRYDVTVSVGPSNQTKRQQAVESMVQFVQAYPNAFPLIGDLLAENMDWPGAKAISERLKSMLPPGVGGDDPAAAGMQAQQQLAQAEQVMQQMQAKLQELQQVIQGKQIEAEAKIQTEQIKAQTELQIAELKARMELLKEQARIEADIQKANAKFAMDAEQSRVDLQYQAAQADADRTAQSEMAAAKAQQPSA